MLFWRRCRDCLPSSDGALDPPLSSSFFPVPDHLALPRSRIDAGEIFFKAAFQQGPMRNVAEIFGDEPDVFLRGHPGAAIEPREVHRLRITAQGPLAAQV